MNVSIFGLGYVGAVSLACLARDGHQVIGVDVDAAKLAMLREGTTPVVEEGMVDLVRRVVASGNVRVTDDVSSAILYSDVSLICVGTPSAPNGSQDQGAVLRLSADIGRALAKKTAPHVLVFRSTLVPGTVEKIVKPIIERESDKPEGKGFHLCFQPEFLREGTSIRDYDRPPFTIVGASDPYPVAVLRQLFGHLPCEFIETSIGTAEMMKYCCNNFHALKITFANETARLCEALGVDVPAGTHVDFAPSALRGQERPLAGGGVLIEDCYNANPVAMRAAIADLAGRSGRRVAVLGDMKELGADEAAYHREVGEALAAAGIDRLIAVGHLAAWYRAGAAGVDVHHFETVEQALEEVAALVDPGDTVLVKGSRGMRLERVGAVLCAEA